jgi:NAD(P)-dependent dehydrogenase (short-subunit alcohol dehydrogenase family)
LGWQRRARVALVARSADALHSLAGELRESFAVPADLSDIEHIPQVIDAVHAHYGQIDGLINNAGRAFHTPIEQADAQLYRYLLDLNVVSVLRLMQCVIPVMRQQGGGVIINISSGLTRHVLPGSGPYASTKHAINGLTLTAREELAAENIRVGLVFPGWTINTSFRQNTVSAIPFPQGRPPAPAGGPMRVDTPEEVAEKILEAVQTEAAETYTASTQR